MIRKFSRSDIPRIMQIWLDGNKEAHCFVPAAYWEEHAPAVEEQLLQAEVYVCEVDGEARGFAGLQGSYLAGIFVESAYRSMGIGKQLLDYVKSVYPYFSLQVYKENKRAAEFYIREGLTIASEEVDEDTGNAEYTMVWKRA